MLVFLALLPAIVLIWYIYKLDEIEKEPRSLLLKIFVFGMISTIPAMIIELLLSDVLDMFLAEGTVMYNIVDAFIVVAITEEVCKRWAAKRAWNHPAFDYRFDAIVYCVVAALGFAALENIFYVMDGGLSVAIVRAIMTVPSHAIDGVIMGYFFGQAKEFERYGDIRRCKKYLRLSVLIPAIDHGIFDCALSFENGLIMMFFVVFVILVDIWAIKFLKKQAEQDRPL